MNKKNKILIIFLFLGLILIFFIYLKFNIPCLFKKTFHIPCPACGMTRAIKSIMNFNIYKSFSYNILTFPLIIIIFLLFITTIIDLLYNKHYLNKIINTITKNYHIIIILLIISWIINIYKQI